MNIEHNASAYHRGGAKGQQACQVDSWKKERYVLILCLILIVNISKINTAVAKYGAR